VTQPEATDPGLRISVTGPAEVTAGRTGVELFLDVSGGAALEGFSVAREVNRNAAALRSVDLEGTAFEALPPDRLKLYQDSDFFRTSLVSQPGLSHDLLLAGALLAEVAGEELHRFQLPQLQGAGGSLRLLRIVINVREDVSEVRYRRCSSPGGCSLGLGPTERLLG